MLTKRKRKQNTVYIRYELADFVKTIEKGKSSLYISEKVSEEISNIMEAFQVGNNLICI